MGVQRSNSILSKIRSPDIRYVSPTDEDGYLVPKSTDEYDNSNGTESVSASCMARKNIHNLSIEAPDNAGEYLPMRSPHSDPVPCTSPHSGYYTSMSRSATPSRGVNSPSPLPHPATCSPRGKGGSVFEFPPSVPNSMYMRSRSAHDSGVYSPSPTNSQFNPMYHVINGDSLVEQKSPLKTMNGLSRVHRSISMPYNGEESSAAYQNIPIKLNRLRSSSETSSGLGSIEEDPSRESLLGSKQVDVPFSIPEEQMCLQQDTFV